MPRTQPSSIPDAPDDVSSEDQRYRLLMSATRAAARRGYDAVSMRGLAKTCKMSLTTVYQLGRSKDQLIAAAHAGSMESFQDRVLARPPRGTTAAKRVRKVLGEFVEALVVDEILSRTVMRAIYAAGADLGQAPSTVDRAYRTIIDTAIGDESIAHRDQVISTLAHVIDSVLYRWTTGRYDAAWVRKQLDNAVVALLPTR